LRILVINPGSTSTAIALFEDDKLLDKDTIRHGSEELSKYKKIVDQHKLRAEIIINFLKQKRINLNSLGAIVITGNGARNKGSLGKTFVGWIKEMVNFIAPITVYPGSDEMKALALGVLRVLKGEEKAQEYK